MSEEKNEKRKFVKDDFVILAFAKKQMFNERESKDKVLVNVALPSTSKYKGYYMSVDVANVKDDKYRETMSYVYLYKEAMKQITKYNKDTKERHQLMLGAEELKEEFDSWRSLEEKEILVEDIEHQDEEQKQQNVAEINIM